MSQRRVFFLVYQALVSASALWRPRAYTPLTLAIFHIREVPELISLSRPLLSNFATHTPYAHRQLDSCTTYPSRLL